MDIVFTFSNGATGTLEVTGSRAVLVPREPDGVVIEELAFGTAIVPVVNGPEQRTSFRKRPRQAFEVEYVFDVDSSERRRFSNFLFGAQERVVALPIMHEGSETIAATTAGATVFTLRSTAFMDFRIGGPAVVFSDEQTFDVATVQSINATQITFATPAVNAYAAGATVAPIRFARIAGVVQGRRPPLGIVAVRARYDVVENDIGAPVGDVSGLPTVMGRLLHDGGNVMPRGDLSEAWDQDIYVMDGETGVTRALSDQDRNRHSFQLGFKSSRRSELWATRQLLYALRGRFTSFWVPSRADDIEVVDAIAQADDSLTVVAEDYGEFVAARQSKATLRLTLTDGTTVVRTVISAEPCDEDAGTEILKVDSPWPDTYQPSQIARAEWLELVRFASDVFQFEHTGRGVARLQTACLVVRDPVDDNSPEDWGFVSEAPTDYDDWGLVADPVTSTADWGGV